MSHRHIGHRDKRYTGLACRRGADDQVASAAGRPEPVVPVGTGEVAVQLPAGQIGEGEGGLGEWVCPLSVTCP